MAKAHEIVNETSADIILALGRDVEEDAVLHRFLDETGKLQLVTGKVKAVRFDQKVTVPASQPQRSRGHYTQHREDAEIGRLLLSPEDFAMLSASPAFRAVSEAKCISVRSVTVDTAPASMFEAN